MFLTSLNGWPAWTSAIFLRRLRLKKQMNTKRANMIPPIAAPTLAPTTTAVLTPDGFLDGTVEDNVGVENDVGSLANVPKV